MARLALAAPALGLFASAALAQTGTLDQSLPRVGGGSLQGAQFNVGAAVLTWQQQVRAGLTGQLEGILVTLTNAPADTHVTFTIRSGDAWSTGPALYTGVVTKPTAGQDDIFIDMTAANVNVISGQTFVVEINGGEGVWMLGTYMPPASGPHPYAEPLFLNNALFTDNGWRLGFNTYVLTGGPVPCYANCDNSTAPPILNVLDFNCFLNQFSAGASYANCDGSTVAPVLNVLDFNCFLNRFSAGCP